MTPHLQPKPGWTHSRRKQAYSHVVSHIDAADGGGFMFTMPDVSGVVADGATELNAIADGRDAFIATASAMEDMGRQVLVRLARVSIWGHKTVAGPHQGYLLDSPFLAICIRHA